MVPPENFIRNFFISMFKFLSYNNLFPETRLHHPFLTIYPSTFKKLGVKKNQTYHNKTVSPLGYFPPHAPPTNEKN
jgi:hypothetical protein